ncbi:MAG: hypothetical protein AAB884_02285, partial [Patescibacteria group bacterium]
MEHFGYLGKILEVRPVLLHNLDAEMQKRLGRSGVIERVAEENEATIHRTLTILNSGEMSASHVKGILRTTIAAHERAFLGFLEVVKGADEFERAANLARKIARVGKGFFLKRERAEEILRKRIPGNLLKFLGIATIEEAIRRYDVTELFSALRFVESDDWMHETFEIAYSDFTKEDFEERDVEIKVLGPAWQKIAEVFVAKKHHNVSHLKEFGV